MASVEPPQPSLTTAQNTTDPATALPQILTNLQSRSDTSRFVGLSLLRTLLDTHASLRDDPAVIQQCWAAIPNKFLVRLLRTKGDGQDARNMRSLGVAVVHTFANLLSQEGEEGVGGERMMGLLAALVGCIGDLESIVQMLGFQAIGCIVATARGAVTFVDLKELDALQKVSEDDMDGRVWREILMLHATAWRLIPDEKRRATLLKKIKAFLNCESKYDEMVLRTLAVVGPQMPFLPEIEDICIMKIQRVISTKPSEAVRTNAIDLAAQQLRQASNVSAFTTRLYNPASSSPANVSSKKPFAYVFPTYILITLRSTLPSLISLLASPMYTTKALHMASCYDLLGAFTLYLISLVELDIGSLPFDPQDLMKLRKDINETFSLTLEFFRDRWDALIAGAPGIDASARTDPKAPKMVAWDGLDVKLEDDPVILAGLRALSVWLKESAGEEDALVSQTLDIADMLMGLYRSSSGVNVRADFRQPILGILQAVLPEREDAVLTLLENKGWDLMVEDLKSCVDQTQTFDAGSLTLVSDIIRTLVCVATSSAVPQSRESWLELLPWILQMSWDDRDRAQIELLADLHQLGIVLFEKVPTKVHYKIAKHWAGEIKEAVEHLKDLKKRLKDRGEADQGLLGSLHEIAEFWGQVSHNV